MCKKIIVLSLLAMGFVLSVSAQKKENWKDLKKKADAKFEEGDLLAAGEAYAKAWELKPKKLELIYNAGECYYNLKAYREAANAYRHVKDKNEDYPLVGLKYARSLKQDGNYREAIQEFRAFNDTYSGQGKAILSDIIQKEISGCDFALELSKRGRPEIDITRPGSNINSDDDEFAPFPFSTDKLYYSSTMGGKARILSAGKVGKSWDKGTNPANFPLINNGHYCNGALSPDGSRFYFTICNDEKGWKDLETRCEIFVIKKSGESWTRPQRLPDYVNNDGISSTHPTIAHVGGQEYIYYASNRDGGRGGMDIWYITRDLGRDDIEFTFPTNCGPVVNTLGDEITPFYAADEGRLFFSSNGHINIGGFDVFHTDGDETNWGVPENIGLPINSSADDYYYVNTGTESEGYVVSNRVSGGEKTNTINSDIFYFAGESLNPRLKGNVYDKVSGSPLASIVVSLYQIYEDGTSAELTTKEFNDGTYAFELLPNRTFKVDISSDGYAMGTYQFVTNDPNTAAYGQPLFLEPETNGGEEYVDASDPASTMEDEEPAEADENTGEPMPAGDDLVDDMIDESSAIAGEEYVARGTSPTDKYEYRSAAPRHQGMYYKIQLVALGKFDPEAKIYAEVRDLGRLDTEVIVERSLTRVLLADFFSREEAFATLEDVKDMGFGRAYVVQYENGQRFGRINE